MFRDKANDLEAVVYIIITINEYVPNCLSKMLMNIIMMTHKNGIGYKLKSVIVMQISLKKHGLQISKLYVNGILNGN